MGIIKVMKSELKKSKKNKEKEKELLYQIAELKGKQEAIRVQKELKETIKGGSYKTYVLRVNMVLQLLIEGVKLEDAICRAKKY